MTKIDSLRRYLLPCITPTTTAAAAATATKKRLSTSLREDIIPQLVVDSSSSDDDSISTRSSSTTAPRHSKSMVIGTFYGHRRGHLRLAIQHDRRNPKPALLLHLSIPTHLLLKEMRTGLLRILLDSRDSADQYSNGNLRSCPLHSVPMWNMCVNGRKVGFASKRRPTHQDRLILKTMQSTTVGAGVLPPGLGLGPDGGADHEEDLGELVYMRANYERVVGSADSESFHLVNPDACPGQELSVFLMRHR
ncbi:hypothetical protein Scep_005473 [Stephania cephalantha]|uniref:Protein MIZU-KUSSEI 1 n=1 Tax=Stephania cephalantha TaxID=152367 RepID=A0AAP0KW08_9MAGN